MSYGIVPIGVSLEKVKRAIGSKDEKLLMAIRRDFRSRFDQDAEDFDADEGELALEDAVKRLVVGDKLGDKFGHKYGYALEILCLYFGEHLSNSEWSAIKWEWIEEVDKILKEVGVKADVFSISKRLVGRGAPIAIPKIDDFPSIGYLLEAEISKVIAEFTGSNSSKIDNKEVVKSIVELKTWFDQCTKTHRDLICFYY